MDPSDTVGAPASSDDHLQQALGDAYLLEGRIGRGGMARVYRAHDRKHDRRVALKVLRPELAAAVGPERFRREIRLVARLQHPHILPVFDSGEAEGLLWFTMPLVDGESLRDRLARERQLPVADAVRMARELALALDYANRHGVVHRDVKPENVLLTEDGQTLLADFGVARAAGAPDGGAPLTGTGLSVGTPAYMSPEQGAGESDVDGRSDQYALGCVLYECLTGEPPFTGATPQAVIAKRFAGPAPDVGVLRDGVSSGVRAALARALGRSPADRFPTTAAFEAALAADSGRVDTPPDAARPATPRGRGLAAASALGIAALALGASFVVRRARGAGDRAAPAASAPADRTPLASRQLTFTGAAEEPVFSPDGRQVAYVETQCERTTGGRCTAALRVQDLRSTQSAVLLTAERVLHPYWSADGAWLLALVQPNGGELGTYLVPRLAGDARRIGGGALATFSSTGDTVLVSPVSASGAPRFVRRVRTATGETIDSTPLPPELAALEAQLPSPSGRWLALRVGDRLMLATPDRRVTDSVAFPNSGSLRWDPRGDALYSIVPGVGTTWLIRARVDDRRGRFSRGVDTVLNLGAAAAFTFDVSPDGRTLVRTGGTLTTTLWALDLGARPPVPRRLAASTAWLGAPYLSSDGYDATDQSGNNVYVMSFAGGPGQPVTRETSGRYTYGWVPGAHRVTYVGGEMQSPLYAQDFPDGPRRVIGRAGALPVADGGSVELDAPRRRLLFRAPNGTEDAIALPDSLGGFVGLWAVDADGGGAYLQALLAATGTLPRTQIVRVDRASGAFSRILDLPSMRLPYAVAAQQGAVVYASWPQLREVEHPTIWRVQPGRQPTMVAELPLDCVGGTLAMSADGRRFACLEWTRRPDLFLIESFDRYRR